MVGDWYGTDWFINEGLNPGDQLVVDGGMRLSAGAKAIVVQADGVATGKAKAATSKQKNP
jgi:membrane fusion protein (multidrug efflux system)